MRTLYDTVDVKVTVPIAVIDSDTTTNGAAVDLADRALGYRSAVLVAVVGGVLDGTYGITVEHSTDGSTWEPVPDDRLQGAFVAVDDGASGTVQMVGYHGTRRYLRASVESVGVTDGATLGVLVLPGYATRPVDRG